MSGRAFRYPARKGQRGTRLGESHRLVSLDRRRHLVARDARRHGPRTFRADRLSGPEPAGAGFRRQGTAGARRRRFHAGERVQECGASPPRWEVVLDGYAPAERGARLRGAVGHRCWIREAASRRARMYADSFTWPALVLAAVGADFAVVAPGLGD